MTDATSPAPTAVEIVALGARHGLTLAAESVTLNELGLDFRVAHARTPDGEAWVLRIPRRGGMAESIRTEAAVLRLVAPRLGAAVPDWRVCTDELIAYPLLPGSPGLTLGADGEPVWHMDVSSREYATQFADLVARMQAITPEEASAAGLDVIDAAASRSRRREQYERVADAFAVAAPLRARWESWLDDDSYWPTWTAFGHGELYQGHVLLDGGRISAVIDWTTGGFDDPARDLAFQKMTAPPEIFDLTVRRFAERGGRTWSRLAEHCAELLAFGPVAYGLYALETGDDRVHAAAQAGLDPQD
ncbi:aminoglycoside phosphotransferase [Occultella glacieicola]|uniref:Aminoglycoside phosphotransferase n=1 Tax=Occultella glacieicola TaxID=2518684 RepID=A0ABY2EBX5_9MICO|nr:macrolide 2'-phosphotransferase [Occultella glacieicola]TDE98667.1 aminoglycoside phosphotransferase [Occultella glacieicola]